MPTELIGRRVFAAQVIAGADQMVGGMWLPAHTVLKRVRGYCVFEAAVERGLNQVSMGAIAGYILPVVDPDAGSNMATIWDTQVPKDVTSETLDLDEATASGAPFWEPGAQKWENLYDVGNSPVRLFERHFLSGMGHNAIAVNRDPESTFDYEYIGGKTIPIDIEGQMRVDGPSLIAFAIGSPLTTVTSATAAVAAISEADWPQLQFIDHVIERALLHLLGLTEAGAETPFEEATAMLKTHLSPPVLEVSGGIFQPTTWNCIGELEFTVEVEGTLPTGKTVDLE